MRFIVYTFMFTMALHLMVPVSAAEDTKTHLAQWRKHILANGNLGGVEFESADYKALQAMGPGILPDIFEFYRREQNVHVLYYIRILIIQLGHFDEFEYSDRPMSIGRRQMEHHAQKPFLSRQIGPGAPTAPARVPSDRDRLVEWWDQRSSFLRSEDAKSRIHSLTGRTIAQYRSFDPSKSREFEQLQVYGIYNIPLLIQLVAEDDNPIAFCDFLRITNHPAYNQEMTNDMPTNAKRVQEAYPSAKDKLKLVCDWWTRESAHYNGIDDLKAAIDAQVTRICGKQ